jgi:hypothetical protein
MATSIFISEDKLKSSSTINGNVDAELLKLNSKRNNFIK